MSGGINTPAQAVAAANSWQTYTHRYCLQAVSRMYQKGSPTQVSAVNPPINDILTAAQEWARCPAQYRHEGLAAILAAPVGALIVCGVGDGHIFIVVAPGMGRSTDYPSAGKMGTAPIQTILNHFSGNAPLGWISWINGNTIDGLGESPVGPMQRVARSDIGVIRRRAEPNTSSALLDPALQPGEKGNFIGYVHGQAINQNGVNTDIWLKGISGNYFWLGGFVDRDLHDLPDLTPAAPPVVTPGPPYTPAALGIDVSGSQAGLDLKRVKAENGVEFVVVKMGGANADTYVTPTYAAQVDAVRVADLFLGHYWNSGNGADPVTSADLFVKGLHDFNLQSDVLMLDNEPYPNDKTGRLWTPAEAVAFIQRVQALTGIDVHRIWHYASASTYKDGQDWKGTVEATGARIVYAAYGKNDATTLMPTASSNPEPGAAIDPDLHQFGSQVLIQGVKTDGIASLHLTATELFATGTVVIPSPPADGGTTPPDPEGGGTTPPDGGDAAPNWFVQLITAIVNAIRSWLGGQKR